MTATLTPENTPEPLGNPQLVGVSTPVTDTTAIPTSVPPIQVAPGAINIAVLGSDRREDWEDWHTDVVQIVSIQPDLPSVTILSVPRDLYLYIPGFWMSRINFADMYGEVYKYEGGGPALLQQTLLYNLGIPIHHYVRTDFDGLTGIVNAIGGIDVPVPCRLQDHWYYPDENGEYPIKVLEPGVRHMDGDWALWYARSRLTSSVFDRERRQQQVLEAIWRKARSLELLPRIPELWSQFDSMISTDMDLTTVLELAQIFFRLDSQNVRFRNIGRQQVIPWTTPHGGSVFLPNWPEMEPVISEALAPVPEGRLWRQLQIVEVWNGSQAADWDQLAADRLLHEGFTAVISPADRQDYAQTRLIDFTGATKGSSIPYLQRMFNVSSENVIVAPDPNMAVQYRLIIGADYQTCPY
ncbi:MAG: LCP family protein [Anaerolineales bacterium]|nr:LCP family protein [Anaerolineales bacterium]